MKSNPLIGITDFTDSDQVGQVLEEFNTHKPRNYDCRLHVGVMMSRNRLLNLSIEHDWERPILSPVESPPFPVPSRAGFLLRKV